MMRANATMRTLADNIKVKNQMNAITLAKSANLPSWERLLQIHIANAFLHLFQVVLELLSRWEISLSISSTGHSYELSFINKTLNADVVCSPDGRNSSSPLEKDIEKLVVFVNDLVII